MPGLAHDLIGRLASAEAFLLRAQSPGGLWRDFALPPGASEAWTTSWVASALAEVPSLPESPAALRQAAESLHVRVSPRGWGYNTRTAPDADSTARSILFLARIDDLRRIEAVPILSSFLDARGAAHTFHGDRFGSWAGAHADVTPTVGLALAVAGASQELIVRVRDACLASLGKDPPWPTFWWTTPAYAVARNVEFLRASGGLPAAARTRVISWLDRQCDPQSAFDAAERLLTAIHVGADRCASELVRVLLQSQQSDGSWLSSPTLLVPAQRHASADPKPQAYADHRRVFTTAAVLNALKPTFARFEEIGWI